jgi:hypothetical protein
MLRKQNLTHRIELHRVTDKLQHRSCNCDRRSDLRVTAASVQLGRKEMGSASRWNLHLYSYRGVIVIANHLDIVNLRIYFPPLLHYTVGRILLHFLPFEESSG